MTRRIWLVYAIGGLAAGGLALALVLTSEHETQPLLTSVLGLLVGWAFIGSGAVATVRRPENRTGLLLALVGFTFFLGALGESNDPVIFTLGVTLESLAIAVFIHLLLAYPGGRLATRLDRVIVVSAYVLVIAAPVLAHLVQEGESPPCRKCPGNELFISDQPGLKDVFTVVTDVSAVVVLLLAVLVLVRRWRSASAAYRRSLRPVLSAGALALHLLRACARRRTDLAHARGRILDRSRALPSSPSRSSSWPACSAAGSRPAPSAVSSRSSGGRRTRVRCGRHSAPRSTTRRCSSRTGSPRRMRTSTRRVASSSLRKGAPRRSSRTRRGRSRRSCTTRRSTPSRS